MHIERIEAYPDESSLLGYVEIFGVSHHATFIKVVRDGDGALEAVEDPHGRLEKVQALDPEGPFKTVQLDEYPGDEWVLYITPFQS